MGIHKISEISDEARRIRWQGQAINVLHSVFVPVVLAGLGAVSPSLWSYSPGITLAAWAVIIVFWAGIWWCARPPADSLFSLSVRLSEEKDRFRELEEREQQIAALARKWNFESISASTLRNMVGQYLADGLNNEDEFLEAIREILSPLYISGAAIFGFNGAEKWSFALYIYSDSRDLLMPIWRERSIGHPGSDKSRTWGRGEGHVGKAFVDGAAIITGDASLKDVKQLALGPALKNKKYDDVYISFASVPVGPIGEAGKRPFGILVATSNSKDRYDKNSGYLLKHYADSIATILALSNLNRDCIINSSPPYSDCVGDSDEENGS